MSWVVALIPALSVDLFILRRQRTTQLATTKSPSLAQDTFCADVSQTPRVFRTPYSLPQPLSLILAFWFLEISIRLDSLHLRTYSGCGGTSSPNSAFIPLNIKYLAMFPKRFVVCGFHVTTPTNEGIGHMKTTPINLYMIVTMTYGSNSIRMISFQSFGNQSLSLVLKSSVSVCYEVRLWILYFSISVFSHLVVWLQTIRLKVEAAWISESLHWGLWPLVAPETSVGFMWIKNKPLLC